MSHFLNCGTTYNLPSCKIQLSTLAFFARNQFLYDKNEITVCPTAVAQGASFSRNQHPRNPALHQDIAVQLR
jgi:hypothetical protein